MSGTIKTTIAAIATAGVLISSAQAQFHSKTQTGQAAVNQQAIQQARMQSANASHSQAGAAFSGGDMILPEGKRQALGQWNPRISQMSGKYADVWGRAIHHSNGSYTESKQDNESMTLEQDTRSKNGVLLQKRVIMLDQYSRPAEVMIYKGEDEFKYRGVLLYDTRGRFAEEQTYDAQGTLIRRKVQEYTPQGLKKPLRSWDYVANVPSDLQLVITDDALPEERQPEAQPAPAKKGLFGQPRGESQQQNPSQGQQAAPNENTSEKRKGLGLGRLFGKKN